MTSEEAPKIEDVDAAGTEESAERADGKRVLRVPLGALVWVALVVASVGSLAGLLYFQYRPDQQTNEAAAQSVIAAAKDGTVAVYTYSANTIDRDIASAQSHLTGDFLSQYKQYIQSPAPSEAKQNAVKTAATVAGAALVELHPGSAAGVALRRPDHHERSKPGNVVGLSKHSGHTGESRWQVAYFVDEAGIGLR